MQFTLISNTPDDTADIATALAANIINGDVVLLYGEVGVGKTDLTRKIIQTAMQKSGQVEDVPSPTFTLVQTYEMGTVEYVHADLYRLSHPDEVFELGLDNAFETAACFVEWPDRLGSLAPEHALSVQIGIVGEGKRSIVFSWQDAKWNHKLADVKSLDLGNT
ncbi:tRNA (adenosine(37)-N6)-threonylcarbamoyltransferase complex ATPase subunit type 1 TsaE [Amylibacter sp. SFDW26]|uniref:tRNA (adenosine(37)-N6)-threonylcarbamoyltransferase complex ATPase subunit type 1 TsaE n=1 Tax=Amylibacter sp. SFDW26 TaxID=2652722 RepID=UPI0012624977|nr:tRNA (adenosine(37)-N6)-threonylcarbamoyltransferase complex ATPase subunit type 1 TsaE [Amylibacter sp. SFDW26]KAB7614621.1 tRNA (adenosine(37)-N6)-threonylcarbamoyltransferase complex ATPase subunit type 1 TsaE [Amylibacter sp. SFDW26]